MLYVTGNATVGGLGRPLQRLQPSPELYPVLLNTVLHNLSTMPHLAEMSIDAPHERVPAVPEFSRHRKLTDRCALVERLESCCAVGVPKHFAPDLPPLPPRTNRDTIQELPGLPSLATGAERMLREATGLTYRTERRLEVPRHLRVLEHEPRTLVQVPQFGEELVRLGELTRGSNSEPICVEAGGPCTVRFWKERGPGPFRLPLSPELKASQVAEFTRGRGTDDDRATILR